MFKVRETYDRNVFEYGHLIWFVRFEAQQFIYSWSGQKAQKHFHMDTFHTHKTRTLFPYHSFPIHIQLSLHLRMAAMFTIWPNDGVRLAMHSPDVPSIRRCVVDALRWCCRREWPAKWLAGSSDDKAAVRDMAAIDRLGWW